MQFLGSWCSDNRTLFNAVRPDACKAFLLEKLRCKLRSSVCDSNNNALLYKILRATGNIGNLQPSLSVTGNATL